MTEYKDCDQFIQFLITNFLDKLPCTLSSQSQFQSLKSELTLINENSNNHEQQSLTATIISLYIYPIKSCAGIFIK